MDQKSLLSEIGKRVRQSRNLTGWTIKEVAGRSSVSPRFLSDLETGRGNISVARLAQVAQALKVPLVKLLPPETGSGSSVERVVSLVDRCNEDELTELSEWLSERLKESRKALVSLVGLRGAGKSTIGLRLANRLNVPFVEIDVLIEEESNLSLSELFSLHDESYYKRLTHKIILRLLARNEQIVIATGGSIVTDPETWALLKHQTHTVWLKASPEDHWERVLGQGDTRPMDNRSSAMTELRSILSLRSPLYSESAQTIDTSSVPVGEAAELIAKFLQEIGEQRLK